MICAHLMNFPTPAGPEIMECREYDMKHQGDDDMNPNTLFWIYGDGALLSMRQVDPCTAGPIVRVTLRNMCGRFVWDAQLKLQPPAERVFGMPVDTSCLDPNYEDAIERKAANIVDENKDPRVKGVLPTADVDYQHD